MNQTNCIFCNIIQGLLPAAVVYRDDLAIAFRDAHPIAPVHILVVPIQHFDSLNDIEAADLNLLGHLLIIASKMAQQEGIEKSGYRLLINTGPDARQSVQHVHVHLIGGKPLAFHVRK
jgi:histidine triad (HIT) family protein